MIKSGISIGDILYDPKFDKIVEVYGFGEDSYGQGAVGYFDGKKKFYTTAYFVFKYFIKLKK